jgi:phospholipase/carboxylesterase
MKLAFLLLLTFITMEGNNIHSAQPNKLITDLSIAHIVKYPATFIDQKPTEKYPLILALHGHGSNEQDLISLSSHLPNNIFWVSGRGPHTIGENSYDWYELPPSPEKIAQILKKLNVFIAELIKTYPIDPDKVFIMGFSQGSMISLSYAMAFPNSISGVISQSGALPSSIGLPINKEGLKGKPMIITHGIEDSAMPIERARQARDILKGLEVDITYNEFHMGHTINNESITSVKEWLKIELKK